MKELIEALIVFQRYSENEYPTHCEHDALCVCHIEQSDMSEVDREYVEARSFFWNEEYDCWSSYKYGSC